MTTTTDQPVATPADRHRAEATALAAKADEWERTRDAALAEADQLEEGAGKRVLTDPDSMASVGDQIAGARTRARLADAAAGEARRGAHAASLAALRAEAAEFDAQIEEAQKRLTEHVAKRDEMLAALIEFSNAEWRIHTVDDLDVRERVARGERITMRHPRAYHLNDVVEELRAKRQRLLDDADRLEANPNWTAPEPPTERDWQADVDEARAEAGQAEKWLTTAAQRLETASAVRRAEAIEAHRKAQHRRDRAYERMHTLVAQAQAFGQDVK